MPLNYISRFVDFARCRCDIDLHGVLVCNKVANLEIFPLKNINCLPNIFKIPGCLLEVSVIPKLTDKMVIFGIKIGGWAFIRMWVFNRIFMVPNLHLLAKFLLGINC